MTEEVTRLGNDDPFSFRWARGIIIIHSSSMFTQSRSPGLVGRTAVVDVMICQEVGSGFGHNRQQTPSDEPHDCGAEQPGRQWHRIYQGIHAQAPRGCIWACRWDYQPDD
ncbi:hypothetical protein N7494_000297 [Penicillium frequentans]|uniref:Uncharacterized protein n=1 Tax=Penicillium frequentans TaxID=3151616 RepID=A0AAD6GLG3_9EURO|nr:hypothetical protein N7494_000297 [Penicillium glabrum]